MDEQSEWDERYAESDRIWSGQPNGALIAEVSGMQPGRVLDVGCGEGADAIWLANCGWQVTALDVSILAVGRAKTHADEAGVTVDFLSVGLLDAMLDPGSFDLVSAQYPALRHTSDHDTEGLLLDLVAPGGTLLFVHHVMDADHGKHHDHGGHHDHGQGSHGQDNGPDEGPRFDPADYVSVADMRARLSDEWVVEVDEERDRQISGGGGAHHVLDEVLRARRT
ncbi:MAG: class I SAM-dependent methyltransferase [Ornithinimicrobium sp.]